MTTTTLEISLIDLATQVNSSYGYDFYHCSEQHIQATKLKIKKLKQGDEASQALAEKEEKSLYQDRTTLYPDQLLGSSLLRKIAGAEILGMRPGWAKPIRLKRTNENNQYGYFVFKHQNVLYYLDLQLFIDRCFELKSKIQAAQKNEPITCLVTTDPLSPLFRLYQNDEELKKFIDALDANNKNYDEYSKFIKKKFKTLHLQQYGWANSKAKSYLIPSRFFTIVEKVDVSAPALTAANLFVNETPNVYPWDLIGEVIVIFANMVYIPFIAYGLHKKLEISAYQYKYNGRNPATNGEYMAIIKNDALILSTQSLAISVFEGFVLDQDLMRRVGNFSADIVNDAITKTTPAEIRLLYHATMAMFCGAILGLTLFAIACGGTYNNPLYPDSNSQYKSFLIGFLAGMSMYIMATTVKPAQGLRVTYELLMNPFAAMCLHHAHTKKRYTLTADDQFLPRNDVRPSLLAPEIEKKVSKTTGVANIWGIPLF